MGSLAGFSKTKPLVLLPLCQLELLAGVGGFLTLSWWSGGQSGEKSPSCPWVAGHMCPSCTCQGLLWRTPQKRGQGGGAGPGYTPLRPLGPKMQDVGQDSVQPGAEGTLAIRTFSALLS